MNPRQHTPTTAAFPISAFWVESKIQTLPLNLSLILSQKLSAVNKQDSFLEPGGMGWAVSYIIFLPGVSYWEEGTICSLDRSTPAAVCGLLWAGLQRGQAVVLLGAWPATHLTLPLVILELSFLCSKQHRSPSVTWAPSAHVGAENNCCWK